MPEMDRYFKLMVEHKTSDLHLCVGCKPMFRKDGSIVPLKNDDVLTPERTEGLAREIMPPRNIEEFDRDNDTDFAYELEGVGRYRVNIFRDNKGVGLVARLIPSDVLTFEQLNSPEV